MLTILASTGRVLWMRWPMLLAWFLAGMLGRYVAIEASGFVGGYWETGGLLLLPLAVLARLTAYVGMFLVVRDGLRELSAIAPRPADARERRAAFVQALLAGMLPFFAVYAASGMLRDDTDDFRARALEVGAGLNWQRAAEAIAQGRTLEPLTATGTDLGLGTLVIIVVAFGLRMAWKRWESRLPRVFSVGAVYLETLWIFFFVWTVKDLTLAVGDWVSHRAAMVWMEDVRSWLEDRLAFVTWVWDGIGWVLGQLGGIVIQPLAWLTVAGVIYGQAIAVDRLHVASAFADNRYVARARSRYAAAPGWVQARMRDIGDQLGSRVKPIGRALLLVWRAGPVAIATYVLLYLCLMAAIPLLRITIIRLFGPQDLGGFWMVADTLIFLAIPVITEPVRVALVASGYDVALGTLRRTAEPNGATQTPIEEAGTTISGSSARPSSPVNAVDAIVPDLISPSLVPEGPGDDTPIAAAQGPVGHGSLAPPLFPPVPQPTDQGSIERRGKDG